MEAALKSLIPTLHSALESLRGPLMPELSASLHDPNRLPDKACSDLAAEVGNLLQDIQQLLRPPAEVLAESFLGKFGDTYASTIMFSAKFFQDTSIRNAFGLPLP